MKNKTNDLSMFLIANDGAILEINLLVNNIEILLNPKKPVPRMFIKNKCQQP